MNNLQIVFVCHNDESIRKIISYNYPIIFVGNKAVSDEFKDNPNIIVARDLQNNIENEPKLLTFTAWYAIIKNNLFTQYEYVCILEYDVFFTNEFILELNRVCNLRSEDVISFLPDKNGNWFWKDINKRVLQSFLEFKQISLDLPEMMEWFCTTNHCIRRRLLLEFVNWYYPDCLFIKDNDSPAFSWYHERCFSLYTRYRNIKHGVLNNQLHHECKRSHTDINPLTNNKYILIYNDNTHTQYIHALIESIQKHSEFKVIIYNKSDIHSEFISQHKRILESSRGGGYWLWKPYIISQVLSKIQDGDYVFYIDSKYFFLENFKDLYSEKIEEDHIILWKNKPNETTNMMKHYCKMDVVNKYNIHDLVFNKDAVECWAGAIFLKKTGYVEKIVNEWLSMCKVYEDISDSPSILHNYNGFSDHRHDQSLLSIIAYKYNIKLHSFANKYVQNVRNPFKV
jgi:hypothetical protein